GTNVAFFTSADGYVNALRIADGSCFWPSCATQIGPSVVAGIAYQPGLGPSGWGLIIAGTYDPATPTNRLVALDAVTGAQVWEFTNGGVLGFIPTNPAVDYVNHVVYFGTKDIGGLGGGVWAVDTITGALRWQTPASVGVVSGGVPTLSADGQTVYIATVL